MSEEPSLRRVVLATLAAGTACVALLALFDGFSDVWIVRLLQAISVFGLGTLVIGGTVVFAMLHLAGWRDPESEAEFEALVQRSELLASRDVWGEGDSDLDDGSGYDDDGGPELDSEEDFRALVRAAVDELPLEFHRALEHVAIVVADNGAAAGFTRGRRRAGAYGLYQGDTVAHDYFHDRIVIFRDTLLRDFGHDPDLLRAQVTRTLRHELAHHLGWDEKGVRGLGL
jgi:predicted Zn-dependent protease with MMP-like domain